MDVNNRYRIAQKHKTYTISLKRIAAKYYLQDE